MVSRRRHFSKLAILYAAAIGATVLFLALTLFPFVAWALKPYRPLDIWVMDKTVPYPDYRKHAGLFWLLKNEKFSPPGSTRLYDERTDYFGFHPTTWQSWDLVSFPGTGRKPDVIYITDTYGVYLDDYMERYVPKERSTLIHGGLTTEDYRLIQQSLGEGTTIIAEFNTANAPTNADDRELFGRLMGLRWNGWIGAYYDNLSRDADIPVLVVDTWENSKGTPWRFSGRGIVLLNEREGKVEVLTEKEDLGASGMKIVFNAEYAAQLGIRGPVSYRYWFEFVEPEPGVDTIAQFRIDLTSRGLSKLDALGLKTTFPAVLRMQTEQYTAWYFAGDFADSQFKGTPFRMAGIQRIKSLLADDAADNNSYFYWKAYVPLMRFILRAAEQKKNLIRQQEPPATPQVTVRAVRTGFELLTSDGKWKPLFIRGVNLGVAEPGRFFTEFPYETATYLRWLEMVGQLGANSIRVYTLLPPEFYRALRLYNKAHPETPLLLFQELWPEEHPPGNDYLEPAYQREYLREIEYGIDAVYGRANVPQRKGRAWGVYATDVSQWLLGWLVGRELESAEVLQTDANHRGATYSGKYVSAGPEASPTEVWLAESLDAVVSIEVERYGKQHPVAIVSWPTLDPLEHDTEWDPVTGKKNRWNDRASIMVEHLEMTDAMKAGIFAAYHIYPNYPDFIVNEPAYDAYRDQYGILRYGGYLQQFIKTHKRYPALVAEFGMANGAGVAHLASDGLHHGGIDETTAGRDILRMLDAIEREGYAGGIIFEFMDEWAKKTWTTEPFKIPFDRRVFWHDAVDPEQNYGLIANEPIPPEKPALVLEGEGYLQRLGMAHDASYLYLDLALKDPGLLDSHRILVGIDTYQRSSGQLEWPYGLGPAESGMEFLLEITASSVTLRVIPSYNIANYRYATSLRRDGLFEDIEMLVNGKVVTKDGTIIPEKRFNCSPLRKGAFDEAGNLWYLDGTTLRVRIPWGRLNVTDPSSLKVLHDTRVNIGSPGIDMLRTTTTDGIVVQALSLLRTNGQLDGRVRPNISNPYLWEGWETAPPYRERIKKSYHIVRDRWLPLAERERSMLLDHLSLR